MSDPRVPQGSVADSSRASGTVAGVQVTPLALPGLRLLLPTRHRDARGFFAEVFNVDTLETIGITDRFVQENHATSTAAGTVRGLHFQVPPEPQAKLVRVVRGAILDVVVDLRRGSPTFGEHVAVELDADAGRQLYVPAGLAHGYCTLLPDTEVTYWVAGRWRPDLERGIRWDDPALGIPWPFDGDTATVSDRDRALPGYDEVDAPFTFEEPQEWEAP